MTKEPSDRKRTQIGRRKQRHPRSQGGRTTMREKHPRAHSHVRPEARPLEVESGRLTLDTLGPRPPLSGRPVAQRSKPQENQQQAQDVLLSHPGSQLSCQLNGYDRSSQTGPSCAGMRPESHTQNEAHAMVKQERREGGAS